MIDERQEELATLYALDLIEGEERFAFERDLSADDQLQRLVLELRNSASSRSTSPLMVRARPKITLRVV